MSIKIKNQKFKIILKFGGEALERSVYKVESEKDNKIYVLKKISILGLNEIEKSKISNEAKILANINHENIVKLIDFHQDNECFYILMEYCEGTDLGKFILMYKNKKENIKENIVCSITLGICLGLEELHRNNIIHRDIKPANIIVSDNYKIKIVDFGVSRKTSKNSTMTKYIGTSYYMAPELIKGENYNNKVDIWSFGCVIYELLSLKLCFYDENLFSLYDKIVNKNYEYLNLNGYNPKWKDLIDLLLKKNYNQRPDIKEVHHLLEDIETIKIIKIENILDFRLIGVSRMANAEDFEERRKEMKDIFLRCKN